MSSSGVSNGHARGLQGDGGELPEGQPGLPLVRNSGARGNMMQMRHIAACRAWWQPQGRDHPRRSRRLMAARVVRARFIATHALASVSPTHSALRTADSGYLTRRLVDVSQDLSSLRMTWARTAVDHGDQRSRSDVLAHLRTSRRPVYARVLRHMTSSSRAPRSRRPAPTSVPC